MVTLHYVPCYVHSFSFYLAFTCILSKPSLDQTYPFTLIYDICYDHALLVTGYDVLLLTLQGNLSFSTSFTSSFASTHAGLDCFSLLDLRSPHIALSDSCLKPHHAYCLMDSLISLLSPSLPP